MRGLWSAALVVATMLVAMGTARAQFIAIPKPAPIVVTVTKSDQRMVVAVDGQPRFKWWVSTGARGYTTPSGHYKVSWLDEHHKSKQYNDAPMPLRFSSTRAKPSMALLAVSAGPHRTAACGSRPATPKHCFIWSSSSKA
jgi:hypothetical protein